MSENLSCYDCNSESLEWVGHRAIVRCLSCKKVWWPTGSASLERVQESIDQKREELPQKGSAFDSYTLMRLNGEIIVAGERVRARARN